MSEPAFSNYLELKNKVSEISPRLFVRSRIINKFLKGKTGSLLDVGCAEGTLLKRFCELGFDCTGIDISKKAVLLAKQNTSALVLQADLLQFKPTKKFDVIVVSEVLQYQKEEPKFLQKIYALLKMGGTLIISEPRDIGFVTDLDRKTEQLHRYKNGELEEKLVKNGFFVEKSVVWGYPLTRLMFGFLSKKAQKQKVDTVNNNSSISFGLIKYLKYFFLIDQIFNFTKRGVGIIILAKRK